MVDRPANAGASGGLAGDLVLPPVVHHHDFPRPVPGYRPEGHGPQGHRPDAYRREPVPPRARSRARGHRRRHAAAARPRAPELPWLSWLPYLIVLMGVAAGLALAWRGSQHAGHGAGLLGAALIVAAFARLVLPPRYAGPLVSRGKALDVLALTTLGTGVLVVALMLP